MTKVKIVDKDDSTIFEGNLSLQKSKNDNEYKQAYLPEVSSFTKKKSSDKPT